MDLSSMMMNDLVIFDESIRSKEDLFERIGQVLEKNGRATKAKKIVKDLYNREAEMSTGIEDGFGIPHAKSKHVLKPTVCFIHGGSMTDYRGLDDQPIECVFAILVPKKDSTMHLDILSNLSRKLMNKEFRNRLKAAADSKEIVSIIENKAKTAY
ncbi:PTS sugar transporter subunit IIA [Candidatus Enterococcus ferrettii]|uniref:PTS system, fructose-specific IIA component n=1 Tax=Candidatus Enterococcus ferrettii TaxID=2815324 RepID=A0ABV0ERF6_9ENTE|nr:PTS sugar transporter subunit IIA [Enterococcus sp. 665A]MBO1342056.1 PTS sugar transporter subunit IIA [Enterococcus sp. 665A]